MSLNGFRLRQKPLTNARRCHRRSETKLPSHRSAYRRPVRNLMVALPGSGPSTKRRPAVLHWSMLHLLRLPADTLLCGRRCPLRLIGLVISWTGGSTSSHSVTNRSISHRPAGPGGVSVLCMACMRCSAPRQSGRFKRTSLPDSISARTTGSGIPPHPSPARRSLCLAA